MPMIRCDADEHYYDNAKYSECPYCRKTLLQSSAGSGPERARDEKTRVGSGGPPKPGVAPQPQGQAARPQAEKTRLIAGTGRSRGPGSAPQRAGGVDAGEAAASVEPVVGWLVVVDGPGKGADFRIQPGQNRIGRGGDMEISINLGDATISSESHAFVVYDYKGNKFYLKHGAGKNLTYLNGEPVLEVRSLAAFDRIGVGDTQLLFMPLCGDKFNWDN